MSAIVANLFGVPGAGKSTGAAYIFYRLKTSGINAELVTEFAKDKVWEQSREVFNNQAYIFGEQSFRLGRCADKVDVIVTDSPLPLSIIYNEDRRLTENFNAMVMDVFNSYDNLNYFLTRTKPYNPVGRKQTEAESNALSDPICKMLEKYDISYETLNGDVEGYEKIVCDIISKLKGNTYENHSKSR